MPYATVNGQRLYYEVGGDGDTVVLLHGALASADIMEAPATGLASGFRSLRIDRRGAGRSSPTEGPVSLADDVADLAALLDWFGVSGTHFLTHDDGAEIAIEFALTHPAKTLSIGLLAPMVDGFQLSPEGASAHAELISALRVDPKWALSAKFLASTALDVVREHEYMFERISDLYGRAAGSVHQLERPPREGPSQFERLGEIQARTGVFVGERDDADRNRCAQAIAAAIPGAELVTFPELSRFLHVEEPRVVMRRLTDFFMPEPEIER